LNDLQVLATDIGNAYLCTPNREKVYAVAGKDFGNRAGKTILIICILYGLKSAGVAWRTHFAMSLTSSGYKSCLSDPDIWLRDAIDNNNMLYYEYLVAFVDDILCLSKDPTKTRKGISNLYCLKN
jgi:hypothetical protein